MSFLDVFMLDEESLYHPSPVNVIPIFCGMFCFLEVFSGGFGMVGLVIVGLCVGVCVCVCVCV